MTRGLRAAHRRIFLGLALLLPAALAAALLSRPAPARTDALPELLVSSDDATEPGLGGEEIAPGVFFRPRPPRAPGEPAGVELAVVNDPRIPDLLAYWSGAPSPPAGGLPADARLLGAVRAGARIQFVVPGNAPRPGRVVLYGLARGEVAGFSRRSP